jgi:hypothetical protein
MMKFSQQLKEFFQKRRQEFDTYVFQEQEHDESEILLDDDEVRKEAYLLWEQSPNEGDSDYFWNKAKENIIRKKTTRVIKS